MIGLAAKDVDRAAFRIVFALIIAEQRPGGWVGYSSPRLILVQGALKRAHQHAAFRAIIEYHAQSRVETALVIGENLAFLRDIGLLPADDEKTPLFNLGF